MYPICRHSNAFVCIKIAFHSRNSRERQAALFKLFSRTKSWQTSLKVSSLWISLYEDSQLLWILKKNTNTFINMQNKLQSRVSYAFQFVEFLNWKFLQLFFYLVLAWLGPPRNNAWQHRLGSSIARNPSDVEIMAQSGNCSNNWKWMVWSRKSEKRSRICRIVESGFGSEERLPGFLPVGNVPELWKLRLFSNISVFISAG